jgi:hypothetical protein
VATEPITLFSREPDPSGVARLLRTLGAVIEGPDDDWTRATVVTGNSRSSRRLIFTHDRKYYSQPGWSVQLRGMHGYFSRFPDVPGKERVLALIPTFRFALATIHDPDFDDGDERLEIISRVAKSLDAVVFMLSSLRDASGRILLSADGKGDPTAVWPDTGT